MVYQHLNEQMDGKFILTVDEPHFDWNRANADQLIHVLWNRSNQEVYLEIDGIDQPLPPNAVTTTTYFHKVREVDHVERLTIFSFNRPYYCIRDHDHEVSCNGVIFFGAQQRVVSHLDEVSQRKFGLLLEVFKDEFGYQDNVQGEMLVMLLKRLIILCTRLAKKQVGLADIEVVELDTIRKFNFLVDIHFRERKTVKEYADLLFKSPKTLSNLFSLANHKSPLQRIHERIALEAKRLLIYTDKSVNEIAWELGFEEPATFFKLFKKQTGSTPQHFREDTKSAVSGSLDS